MVTETPDNIRSQPLVEEMRTSYLDYAMSVIVSRALPDVRDGLKPVQRRILYAMDDLGMRANQPYRKSARIVGEVLGKYHPHGDVPVYEAMVRMAQSWSMRAPLIDGQGNYGSIDHDPPAAMRYTEARLSAICEEMLADLDKNTVDFTPNFDESLNEPTVLPGRIPNLLLNGAAGIAVAMACKIPPHNLSEIAAAMKLVLANEDTSIADLLEVLKGPDFPTAGIIFAGENREDLRVAYARGRGGFTLRGRQHIEEASGSRVQIVFTEIPYQSNKVRIVEQIALHVREKKIEGIRDLRDESDRHGLRLVVELGRDANLRTVLAHLFRSTDLQVRYDTNFVALTPEQDDASSLRPRTFNLLQMITAFIDHRRVILTRRTEFDLEKARDRHHIVEGLLKAIDMIDEIIAAIRAADSADAARDTLQEDPFELSERQAQAVLDMQLRRLATLERTRLEEEYQDLIETIEYLEGLLADSKKIDAVIIEDLDELVETYGTERKTQIIDQSVEQFSEADLVPHQPSVVTLTRHGYIKRQAVDAFRSQRRGGVGVKGVAKRNNGNAAAQDVEAPERLIVCDTHDQLLLFTDRGRVYCMQAHEIEERSREWRGLPVQNLLDLQPDESVTTVVPVTDFGDDFLILGTRQGQVKKTPLSEFANVRRSGLIAFNLPDDDELVEAAFARAGDDVLVMTSEGMAIRFTVDALRQASRISGGVRGIVVPEGQTLVGLQTVREDAEVLTVTAGGFGKRTPVDEYTRKGRGGKGMIGHKISEETREVVGMCIVRGDEELVMISAQGKILRTLVPQIRRCGRSTKGVTVMKVTDGDVASIAVVDTTREFGQQE